MATITLSLVLLDGTRAWSDGAVETIVLVRHGEKPDKGLGQLDCQGLNRALALPPVIAKTFGRPSAIFAPDPSRQKQDDGVSYDYVRPPATIEPTAIFFGLPVNASRLAEAGRVDMEISPCPQIPSIANRSCSCTVGLIIVELVINASKYAFADRKNGVVRIDMIRSGRNWHCIVSDNGIGMDGADRSTGLNIVDALVRSLNGRLIIRSGASGTRVCVVLPDHSLSRGHRSELDAITPAPVPAWAP